MSKKKKQEQSDVPQIPPIGILASGVTEGQKEQNLAMCQGAPGWPDSLILLADAISKHADTVMMDFTRDAVSVRYQIDGMWHDLPRRDRASGDAMLAVLKKLCNLNPDERRNRQKGNFGAEFLGNKFNCMLSCQGVQTGERASLEIVAKEQEKLEKLADLGMRDKMVETFKEVINADSGLILISTMPKQGHSTLWRVSLESTDRFMRDFVALEDQNSPEEEVINITPNYYNPAENQTPISILPSLLLKEPDVLVVPNLTDGETVNALCEQVEKGKLVIARIAAKNAAEALLRVLALKPKRELFARSVKAVINQRLFRTLCDTCKQGYAPAPQMLQKLGIPPGRVQAFYREYQPPPPGQVDDEGNPIPPMICPQCNGIGYRGRSGLFELIMINDGTRQVLVKQPQLASIQQAAKKSGNRNFQEEGILAVCLGSTSLQEIQRVLKL